MPLFIASLFTAAHACAHDPRWRCGYTPGPRRRRARIPLEGHAPRELEVVQLVARGLSNKEIAKAIGRTDETVKIHLRNIFTRLNVDDRTEAVTLALARSSINLHSLVVLGKPRDRDVCPRTLSCRRAVDSVCRDEDHSPKRPAMSSYTLVAALAMSAQAAQLCAQSGPQQGTSPRSAARSDARPTIVLVHGGFVDGCAWHGVYKILRKDGYTVRIV